ncbi:MAG: general secretion pathway protein GspE [Planctomycetaceae bacterium]|nr:general secretion pathway protein GspE [Planctomycetaceae bacterium]
MALDVYKDWLGIPDGPRPPDHYTLLRLVQFEDDTEKIRANYRKLNGHVRKYATGQYSVPSQELLNELAKAMLCLTDPERKREYDESQGREFAEELSRIGNRLTENVLAEQGTITKQQIKEVKEFADKRGLTVRDAVVQMKLADVETATRAFAVELGLSYVDLAETLPDDGVLDRVARASVRRNSIIPLFVDEDYILVACTDEITHDLEQELRLSFDLPVRPVLATPQAISQAISKYYPPGTRETPVVVKKETKAAAPEPKKGKKADKTAEQPAAAPAKKAAAAGPRRYWSQLTPDEQAERKQWGLLLMCWFTIGSVVLDQLVIFKYVWPTFPFFVLMPFFFVPAIVMYVKLVYWK